MATATPEKNAEQSAASGIPKYRMLADLLRRQIADRVLEPGDRLPSFAEIESTHHVTLTTVKRVYDLLEREGLIERQQGRGTFVAELKKTLTGSIGLVGNEYLDRQVLYYNHLLRGIEEFTSKTGQHLVLLNGLESVTPDIGEKVDGLLLCDVESHGEKLKQLPPHLPRVSMFVIEEGISNVIADELEGAKNAVRRMIDLGHRRIACLMEDELFAPQQRYAGYRDALREGGIEWQPAWSRFTEDINKMHDRPSYVEWARTNMQNWLRTGWRETGCTAILAQNDTAAIGIMQALHEVGIDVPREVSIMGFDGTELCDHTIPRLSSMKVPLAEIGFAAAEILEQHIRGSRETRTVVLPLEERPGDSLVAVRNH